MAERLNLSFGNFDFQDMHSIGQRGGGVRELHSLLRHARRTQAQHAVWMQDGATGVERRNIDLLRVAMERTQGRKVRDDPKRLTKALAKKRNRKRSSAKKWAERRKKLEASVENVVTDRNAEKQLARQRREMKKDSKSKSKSGTGGKGSSNQGKKGPMKKGKKKETKKKFSVSKGGNKR
jgi:hypothetical protein